jgi:NADPH:quinone reductase-like Zn-dependent oxidoreductase
VVEVLHVTGPGTVAWVPVPVGALAPGAVRVDTVCSGVSAGTELSFLKGTNPALSSVWDGELGLFRHAEDGDRTWPYPLTKLGYMQVGRVVATRWPHVAVGDLVAATYGHAGGHDLDPLRDRLVVLPRELDPLLGIYVAHMGPICANGLLHAAADLLGPAVPDLGAGVRGRRVLVTGAGVVGLLSALLAHHHGAAEVVVADPTPERLAVAARLGLGTVDQARTDVGLWAKQRWRHAAGDRGADVVLQCRGQAASLHLALRALRPQGTVVDLAFYPGGSAEVRLGEEFHHNGLRVVCAQIGRVPRGLAHVWDRERLSAATVDLLLARGADVRAALVTDLVPARDAPALLADLASRRRHALQAVLTWDGPGGPASAA